VTTIDTPAAQVQRDWWGRPLVIPPGGGRPVAYRRCTRYIGVLDDRSALERWKMRQVAAGLAARPDLLAQAASAAGDKSILDSAAGAAMEAAGSSAAATTGTAVHRLTEQLDSGQEPVVPEAHRADLEAYREATAGLAVADIEVFVVDDSHQVGGTFDRVMVHRGRRYVADIKTGSIEWNAAEIQMQLAMYAGSSRYDPATGARTPLDVEQDWGLVIHLPAGQGRCDLWWANLAEGRVGLEICRQVWRWRASRHRFNRRYTTVLERIDAAADVDQLVQVWADHAGEWDDTLTAAAAARKKELLAGNGPAGQEKEKEIEQA